MPKAGQYKERRNARRFQVGWDLVVVGTDSTGSDFDEAATLANLSSGGAFFYFSRSLNLGGSVELRIRVPFKGENWMKYEAEVVRVQEGRSDVGVAVRFDEVRPLFIMTS